MRGCQAWLATCRAPQGLQWPVPAPPPGSLAPSLVSAVPPSAPCEPLPWEPFPEVRCGRGGVGAQCHPPKLLLLSLKGRSRNQALKKWVQVSALYDSCELGLVCPPLGFSGLTFKGEYCVTLFPLLLPAVPVFLSKPFH